MVYDDDDDDCMLCLYCLRIRIAQWLLSGSLNELKVKSQSQNYC